MDRVRSTLAILALAASAAPAFAAAAGGLEWTAPATWKAQPERPMRAATYAVPRAPGDREDGECAVFYFGPGQGGGVDANIKRWIGQFDAPGGGAADRLAKISRGTVNGLPVTRIDLAGTYKPSGGPMMQAGAPKPGYRLLGAIVEGPQGAVFFKFTGPEKTVAAQKGAFDALLKSVSR
ncbi:MAG: hypothetical protein HYS04_21940 [Acidobacteria bacterium]|nr:hypothetical protein [Acidobacteriota bacterium]